MKHIDLSSVNVIAELERMGWIPFEFAGANEVKVVCPLHDDEHPSCSINTEKKVFRCHVADCPGSKGGDFITFMAAALKSDRHTVYLDLCKRYDIEDDRVIDAAVIEGYHEAIWKARPMLTELYNRGVTDADIRHRRLGFHKGRITIPIPNARGVWVNVRRYSPGAIGSEKMKNTRRLGSPVRLYPADQLKYDNVAVLGGEIKAIVFARLMNEHGFGGVTATAGEGNWAPDLTEQLADKAVWVCMDIDETGEAAADKICAQLRSSVRWLGVIRLPLDKDVYPHGDLNDWVAQEGGDDVQLKQLIEAAEEWAPSQAAPAWYSTDESATTLPLDQAVRADWTGKRVAVDAVVAAFDMEGFTIPSKVQVTCDRRQPECVHCTILANHPANKAGTASVGISPESPGILDMVNAHIKFQREGLMRSIGIPLKCKSVTFEPTEYMKVHDVRLSPQLDIASNSCDTILQPTFVVGNPLEDNESYQFKGRVYPHTRTQQATFVTSEYKPIRDALSSYSPENDSLVHLEKFKPNSWTLDSMETKLSEVYVDLAANATRIFERFDLHLAIGLPWFSPLLIHFDGKIRKAWVEALIIGDSGQGKSDVMSGLMDYFGLGERVEGKMATAAGLLGGVTQSSNGRWWVQWGVIPKFDRQIVAIDEFHGASTKVISKLTNMRATGLAEVVKVVSRRRNARTRFIVLANPRSGRSLSSYSYGVVAAAELIGAPEDMRRFDYMIGVSSREISEDTLEKLQTSRPIIENEHTSELCRQLILWAWTRKPEQIKFDAATTTAILEASTRMIRSYVDDIPIVDKGGMRFKIARLSAALACHTFSHGKSLQTVKVRVCHVKYLEQWLRRQYDNDMTLGYGRFSVGVRALQILRDPKAVANRLNQTPFPADLVASLLAANIIDLQDIQDWCNWDRGKANDLTSFFVRKHALIRQSRGGYRMTPAFIELLRSIKINPRPDHAVEREPEEMF